MDSRGRVIRVTSCTWLAEGKRIGYPQAEEKWSKRGEEGVLFLFRVGTKPTESFGSDKTQREWRERAEGKA